MVDDTDLKFQKLLVILGEIPGVSRAFIELRDAAYTYEFTVQEIKDVLLGYLFTIPTLRKELDEAENPKEPEENKMDTVLKRALHHLEKYAAYYHSSGVDGVVVELRQLIAEGACEQVEGETLFAEPPKWEYLTIPFDPSRHLATTFNECGADGWELVQIIYDKDYAIFKRAR